MVSKICRFKARLHIKSLNIKSLLCRSESIVNIRQSNEVSFLKFSAEYFLSLFFLIFQINTNAQPDYCGSSMVVLTFLNFKR